MGIDPGQFAEALGLGTQVSTKDLRDTLAKTMNRVTALETLVHDLSRQLEELRTKTNGNVTKIVEKVKDTGTRIKSLEDQMRFVNPPVRPFRDQES